MSGDNRSGSCITGKVRYENEAEAAIALERVRAARSVRPDAKPPERTFYLCGHCRGWHLSSRAPVLAPDGPPRQDSETWEEYAHRLECRITAQRDQLEAINADAGNRSERKRIYGLTIALGNMTLRWEREKASRDALLERLRSLGEDVGHHG